MAEADAQSDQSGGLGYAIVAGFGLPGRAVAERLKAKGIPFCVIELNPDTVRRCGAQVNIFKGDATDPQVLQQAGIERATFFAATMPNDPAVIEAVAQARRLNPTTRIVARLEYVSNGLKARRKGADEVIVAEQTVAGAFDELVASDLAAGKLEPKPAEAKSVGP